MVRAGGGGQPKLGGGAEGDPADPGPASVLSAGDRLGERAFLNAHLSTYCQKEGLQFTRSRPYKKNDQAYVEGKNWGIVRPLVGYRRYESQLAYDLLETIYDDWRLRVN